MYAPVLQGFELKPDLYEAINEINTQVPVVKAVVFPEQRQVEFRSWLLADTLSARELLSSIDLLGKAADYFDTLLKRRFGGDTMMADDEETADV